MSSTLREVNVAETFAMLTMDGRRWLLPQGEIHSLEPVFDLKEYSEAELDDNALLAPNPVGAILLAGEYWPIYCLAGSFSALATIPKTRRICILLRNKTGRWGLVCDEIEVLEGEQPQLHPIPACMITPSSPLYGLISFGEYLAYVTTTAHLTTYLRSGLQVEQERAGG